MKNPIRLLSAGLVSAVLALAVRADPAPKKLLFFSKSSNYEHLVIRNPGGPFKASPGNSNPGLAMEVLRQIGARDAFEFTFSKDGGPRPVRRLCLLHDRGPDRVGD